MSLPNGPYKIVYEPSGQHCIIFSSSGHISLFNLHDFTPAFERDYATTMYAATFLTNAELMACGRSRCVSVFNHEGLELHRLPRAAAVT